MYLFQAARFSSLLNLPEGENIGRAINDAMKEIEAENEELKDVMTKNLITVDVNAPVTEVLSTMLVRIPVTDEGRLVGVIARCDILKSYIEPEFCTYM